MTAFCYFCHRMTLAELERDWQQILKLLYSERETANMLRFFLEDVFNFSFAEQRLKRSEMLPADWNDQLENALLRLRKGEPLQHITGFTWFDGLKILVSPSVLIPRPETEELVDWIAQMLPQQFNGRIIDWCTGSGCIALALKNRFPQAEIAGYDWSDEALCVAKRNADSLRLRGDFKKKDALNTEPSEKVDLIVSNPPYIPETESHLMHENVVAYEPGMALFVPDNDPLLFYRAITKSAIETLVPNGQLFFELHENFAMQTKEMIEATNAFSMVELKQDLQGKWRMLRAEKGDC